MKREWVLGFILAGFVAVGSAEAVDLESPGGSVVIGFELNAGRPQWEVAFNGREIIKESPLGLELEQPYGAFEIAGLKTAATDETWKPVWGKFSEIRNCCSELTVSLRETTAPNRRLDIVFRAFDDAAAVRYHFPESGKISIKEDNTHFMFAGDFTCWSANGEGPNFGPVPVSRFGSKPAAPMRRGKPEHIKNQKHFPVTLKVADDCYASLLEAAIYDFNYIRPVAAAPRGIKASFGQNEATAPVDTSWRVMLLGKTAGELVTNNALVNLNPPCAIKDTSWIEPGLALWDWRGWGATAPDGFRYHLDMESWRRQIDFASKHGVKYLLIDANWYGPEHSEESNPVTNRDTLILQDEKNRITFPPAPASWRDPIDMPGLIRYAAERNVNIMLYINDRARVNYDFEQTLAIYKKWGAVGIKYGFMKTKGQAKVLHTREIVELCAKYQLVCDFHDGPVPPSGDRRTWPNYLTREFCHAQADGKRSFSPSTFCTAVFCNMLAGPLDMSNGLFALTDIEKGRPRVFEPVDSTVAGEAARVLITFSGMSIVADIPEAYEAKADLFAFLGKMPLTWDETRILNAAIGKHITTARRSGTTWFIGSACNEAGAELPVKLDFLESGGSYKATVYEDTPDTHFISNKEAYNIREITVKKGDVLVAKLAPGGGHCLLIEKK